MLFGIVIVAGLAGFSGSGIAARQQPLASARWITAWGTSQQGLGMNEVSNATVRMTAAI